MKNILSYAAYMYHKALYQVQVVTHHVFIQGALQLSIRKKLSKEQFSIEIAG